MLGNEPVDPQKRARIDEILAENDKEDHLIVTSVISHLEVLPDKLGGECAEDAENYISLFDAVHFAEIEINAHVLLRAREIRNHYYKPADDNGAGGKMMDLGDAIHLATASIYGVAEFHTRDKDHKGSKVPLINLYAAYEETKLCAKYDLKNVSPESPQGVLVRDQKPTPTAGQPRTVGSFHQEGAREFEADEDESAADELMKRLAKTPPEPRTKRNPK